MGQLFSGAGLTNPAVVDPTSGRTQFYPNPAAAGMAMASEARQTAQPSTASVDNSGVSFNQPQPAQPTMVRPSFLQAAQYGATPGGANLASPALSKLGKVLSFMTVAGQGALAGRAAEEQAIIASGGHRSGGIGTGFEAGYNLPFQRQATQQQLEQQRAQTGLIEAEQQNVNIPGVGPLPAWLAKTMGPAWLRQQGQLGAAQIGAGAKTQAAQIGAKAKLDAIGLQTEIAKQKGVKFLPDAGPDGKQFYHVVNPFGQEIGQADVNVIPSLMAKSSETVDYKEDENGNIIALPKGTVSRPMIPGQASGAAPAGGAPIPAKAGGLAAGGGGPRVVAKGKAVGMVVGTDAQGKQVAGTPQELRSAGVNSFTKLDSGESAKVNTARQLTSPGGLFDLADKDLAQFKPGELEALGPRWNEFLAGTVGTADPRYVALRTHVNGLLSTALMQAHVGARGGERIMEHFEDIANAGKMSKETLAAALNAEKQYVQEKAMRPVAQQGGQGGRRVIDLTQ
jgi:hypothetical protein